MAKIVELSRDEVRICAQLGMERWLAKFGSTDRPNYALGKANGTLERELQANVRANVAEYAVAKLYRMPWTVPWYPNEEHPYRMDHPDVGTNVEVRCIRTRDAIPVWKKDVNKGAVIVGAYVEDQEYFSSVKVFGYLPVEECQKDEWWTPYENSWRVPTSEFIDEIPSYSSTPLHV
jgi:hypothetical protein